VPKNVRLPKLGRTMTEAVILDYKVGIGDHVKRGQALFEIETDKATMAVESPEEGFVKHILAPLGRTLQVGRTVLILARKDEHVPQSLIDSEQPPPLPKVQQAADIEKKPPTAGPLAEKDRPSTPTIKPEQIKLGQIITLTPKQQITARKMLQSKRQIPCFYLDVRADVTALIDKRAELNKTADTKVAYNDFIILALAKALLRYPLMTGRLEGETIKLADRINIAFAVVLADGLLAPVVRNANEKNIARISRETTTLIEKAQNRELTPDNLTGACITISNLGAYGVHRFIPIVVPGQCSILGIGRITDTCLPNDSKAANPDSPEIVVRKLMNLTLSVDHRIANGAYAAQFLDFTRNLLEDPASLS